MTISDLFRAPQRRAPPDEDPKFDPGRPADALTTKT